MTQEEFYKVLLIRDTIDNEAHLDDAHKKQRIKELVKELDFKETV